WELRFSCLLLVLLSAAQCTEGATYEDFKDKHIRKKEDIKDCKDMMENMKDKNFNTFIIDSEEDIIQVCKDGTPMGGNIYKSKRKFDLFDCKLGDNKQYTGVGIPDTIQIACISGKPVHFETHPNCN
uniref:Ribonuclease A-domain domain-containing protein n=1 Tax=Seriola lalandi dorsalis TaxID=1841481 RepID=A0A3B4WPV4_SERLL